MKRIALIGLISVLAAGPAAANDVVSRVDASRAAIQQFAQSLQGELQAAMQAGGAVQAIEVCHTRAPEIARQVSRERGVELSRTSLKIRNPGNRPGGWEREVLESFDDRRAGGEQPMQIEQHTYYVRGDEQEFRFMKAIPTGEVCLTCHGTQVQAPVEQALKRLYPNDAARGYSMGDIRGAFIVRQPM
jgi:hypothetical protein